MAFQYTPKAERFPEPGKLESAWRNTVGGFANTVGSRAAGVGQLMAGVADEDTISRMAAGAVAGVPLAVGAIGIPKSWWENLRNTGLAISDWGQSVQEPARLNRNWEDKGVFDRLTNWDYWTDPRGATADIAEGFGSSALDLLLGGAITKGVTAAGKPLVNRALFELGANGGKTGRAINDFLRTPLGGALGETAGTGAIYSTTTAPMDAVTNAAEIIKPLKERGYTDSEIAQLMTGAIAEELPIDLMENFITGNTIFGKGFGLKGKTWKGRLGYGSLNIPLEMLGEYGQEGYQTRATQKYQGLPHTESPLKNFLETGELFATPEEKSAATSGAIGGALPAAGGTLHHAVTGEDEQAPPSPEQSDKALRSWTGRNTGGEMNDFVHDTIVKAAKKYDVPVERALATAMAESTGNPYAVSPVGAIGVMQLMPETATGLGVDPYDIEQNIDGGVRYLKQMYDQFGDWDLAHAAYNAGAGTVNRYGGMPPYSETQNYVSRINGFLGDLPDYQGGEQATGDTAQESDEDIYVGENGKGEGTYWVRNEGASLDGAQPDLLNAIDMLGKKFFEDTGHKLVVTAGTNGNHAEGEHSHGAGWKVDIADAGANGVGIDEDGALFNSNFEAQPYLKDFIAYGRSLGLGMNLEDEGTSNVHIDVALDGTQWDGNGEHAGGFNPKNGRSRKGGTVNPAGATPPDDETGEDSDVKPAPQPATYENIIKSILGDNDNVKFNTNYDDEGTLQSISDFATSQKDTATGNAALNLQSVFDTDGTFIPGHKSRKTLEDTFGDELTEFGQGQLNQRWSDLIKKSMQPGFIDNLTEDDKRLFGNILLNKMKNAGIDLKKDIPAVAKQKIKEGDEKTTVNAWQMLQDKLQQNQEAEPIISEKTQQALDDIAKRVDELTLSSDETAGQQTQDLNKLYKDITKLSGEITKLNQDREKASQPQKTQAAQVDAQAKIAKIDADIKKKQADLDAKIDSFYNPQQAPKVEPSQVFAPVKAQADNAIAKINQQIDALRQQGFDDTSDEIDQLNDKIYDIQTLAGQLADLDAQIVTAKQQKQAANDDKARGTAKAQQDKATSAYGKAKRKLDTLLKAFEEPAPPEPPKPFRPVDDFVTDELAKLRQDKQYLKDNGGTADEINALLTRQKKIKDTNNRILQDMDKAQELEEKLAAETDPQKREALEDQLTPLQIKIRDNTQKLRDYINPPQPAKPEPSKHFTNDTKQAGDAITSLEQQIDSLKAQGFDDDSDEIEQLNDKRWAIQAAVDKMADLDAKVDTAKKQKRAAEKANDAKARQKAEDQRKTAVGNYKKARQELNDLLTPKKEPTPPQKLPAFSTAIEDGLASFQETKKNLRSQGGSATDINDINKRIKKIQTDNAELVKLGQQAQDLEQQINDAPDDQKRSELQDNLDAVKASIESKQAKLENYINPPQKKSPKTYDALPDDAKEELRKVNRQLLDMDDSGTTKGETTAKDLNARREKLTKFNNDIGQLQDKVHEAAEAWTDIKDSDAGENEKAKIKAAYEVVKENLAKKKKELDEYIHPPVKEEKKPEPFVPYDDEVRDRLAELNNRIDSEQDPSTIKEIAKERDNITDKSKVASGLQKQIDEQKAIMNDASKTPDERQRAKVKQANLQIDLDTAKNNLNEALHPKPKPEKAPEHYEPTDEAKDEIDKLDAEIDELRKEDEEANSAEIRKKSKRRDAIQEQVDKIGKLESQIAKKENERRQAEVAGKTQTVNKLTGEIADKRETLKEDRKELNNLLHPRNEDDEPAKTYAPVNDTVKAAFETLDKKIAQAPENSVEEIDLQTDQRELRRKNDRVAKLQDEAEQLKKNVANTKEGTKAREDAEDKLDAKRKTLRTALVTLNNAAKKINPPPKPEPKPEHYPLTGEAQTETDKLYDEIDKLSDTPEKEKANAEQIKQLYDRIGKIQTAFDNVEKAKENLAEWGAKRDQAENPGQRRTAGQKISDWNTKLQNAEKALDDALHPRNEDDEPVKTYAPVNDTVKAAFDTLNQKIAKAPKGSEEKLQLELDREALEAQNAKVAEADAEIETLSTNFRNAVKGTKTRNDIAKKLSQKIKAKNTALTTLNNMTNKINPQPEPPKEPKHYKATGEVKDEIDRLNAEIKELYGKTKDIKDIFKPPYVKDTVDNADELAEKINRRKKLQDQVDTIGKHEAIIAKKEVERQKAEDAGDTQTEDRLIGEIAQSLGIIQKAHDTIDKTLHPKNEDDEPVKTYQPVNDTVKGAFETLDKKIAQVPEGSKERRDLERARRELNGQNTTVAQADEKIKQLEEVLGRKQPGSKGEAKVLRDLDTAEGNRDRAYTRLMKLAGAWTQKTNAVEPIDDNVAKAIADLEKQIADAMDKGKSVAELEDRLGEIIQLNDRVASNRRNAEKREKDKQQALRNHNAKKANAIQRTIDWHTPRDAKIEKQLNDLVNPQEVKKEEPKKTEPPKEIEIEDEQVLAKLDSLQEEIDELKAEDEMINEQEIKEKENLHKKINDTAKAIAKFKAQGKNTTQPEESLKKLMTPKPPQKRKGVTPQARVALESLNKQQASLTKGIAGKSPEERKQIIQKLADIQQAIKDLHEQNSLTAALQDKVGRISTALGEAANKNDSASLQKYSDLLNKYQPELENETTTLNVMAEPYLPAKKEKSSDKATKEKSSKKKTAKKDEPVKTDEPKPAEQQPVKVDEQQTPPPEPEQPKTDEQAEVPEESDKKPAEPTPPDETQQDETPKPQESTQASEQQEPQEPEQAEIAEPEETLEEDIEDEGVVGDDENEFGSTDETFLELDKVLAKSGITPIKQEKTAEAQVDTRRPKLVDFVDDSEENEERLAAEWKKETSKLSANPIFNPKLWRIGLELGAIYVQRGINHFADWAKKMSEKLGKESEPWQTAIWETINAVPEGSKFDEEQVMAISRVIGGLQREKKATSLDDVRKQFAQRYGEEAVEQILPMIRASYTGIGRYFTDQEQRAAKEKKKAKKEPTNPLEKAVQKIADLIDEWNEKSLDAWQKKNPHRAAPPTREVQELADMVSEGVVNPDKAVDAANKLLNGELQEQNKAREVYYEARAKRDEKQKTDKENQPPAEKPESPEDEQDEQDEEAAENVEEIFGVERKQNVDKRADRREPAEQESIIKNIEQSYDKESNSLIVNITVDPNLPDEIYDKIESEARSFLGGVTKDKNKGLITVSFENNVNNEDRPRLLASALHMAEARWRTQEYQNRLNREAQKVRKSPWSKQWSHYERKSYGDTIWDRCSFHVKIDKDIKEDAWIRILWKIDPISQQIKKIRYNPPGVKTYVVQVNPQGLLLSIQPQKLVAEKIRQDLPENVYEDYNYNDIIHIDASLSYECDNYETAQKVATMLKKAMQEVASEHQEELIRRYDEEAERKAQYEKETEALLKPEVQTEIAKKLDFDNHPELKKLFDKAFKTLRNKKKRNAKQYSEARRDWESAMANIVEARNVKLEGNKLEKLEVQSAYINHYDQIEDLAAAQQIISTMNADDISPEEAYTKLKAMVTKTKSKPPNESEIDQADLEEQENEEIIESDEEITEDADEKLAESEIEEQPEPDVEETPDEEQGEIHSGEIVYPDGALTYGDKSAVEEFKTDGHRSKALMPSEKQKFDDSNQRKTKINGQEMTRLEVVEAMAKGELPEDAMKLNKREDEYLKWLKKFVIDPLQKIQQADIQNERANKAYRGLTDRSNVYFEDSKDDAETLANLEKLAKAYGGTATENTEGNIRFKFSTGADTWAFHRAADFFMNNRHLDYFSNNAENISAIKAEKERQANISPIDKARTLLKNITTPEGVNINKIDIEYNRKHGVWRVKPVGKYPNDALQRRTRINFMGAAQTLNGKLDTDGTYHFKTEDDARQFKQVLDEYFGFEKKPEATTPKDPNELFNQIADTATSKLMAQIGGYRQFTERMKSLGNKMQSMLKDGKLTQAEATKLAYMWVDASGETLRQFERGDIARDEAQEKLRAAASDIENRLDEITNPPQPGDNPKPVDETEPEETAELEEQQEPTQVSQQDDNGYKYVFTYAFRRYVASKIKTDAGRKQFINTMNTVMNYNGVKESRRQHIENLFKEHPEYTAAIYGRLKGTKDIYGFAQTDYQIYHGAISFADGAYKTVPFEYITRAEKNYFEFLQYLHSPTETSEFASKQPDALVNQQEDKSQIQAQVDEQAPTKDNPFDVEIPQNSLTQREDFQKAYSNMQGVWDKYQKGELDIREAQRAIDKIENDWKSKLTDKDKGTEAYVATSRALFVIRDKIDEIAHSPEEQAKHKDGFKKLVALHDKIQDAHKAGNLSDKEYSALEKKFNSLTPKAQRGSIAGQTAYQRLKEALPKDFDENEEASGNVEESGTGERLDDRYRDVEPDVREGTDEEERAQGSTEISGEDIGQQRPNAEDVGTRNPESNAQNARPAETDDTGGTGARTGTGNGVRGNTGTVQPASGDKSGNAGVSPNADNVTDSTIEQRAREVLKKARLEGETLKLDDERGVVAAKPQTNREVFKWATKLFIKI